MKKIMNKTVGISAFVLSLISMLSMTAFAATAQDYEKMGESFAPLILIGIGVLIFWFIKKR